MTDKGLRVPDKRLAELAAQAELAAIEQEHEASEISVTFQISYHCEFGQCLAVIGSSSELGNWELRKDPPRMRWSSGDLWTTTLKLKIREFPIQYKYIVVEHGTLNPKILRWEAGNNHICSLRGKSVLNIKLFDRWKSD